MVKINWSRKSTRDLENIYKYIAKNSLFFANKTRQKLYQRTQILKDFPEIGKIVPEFELEPIRELIEGNYRIIYKISNPNLIEIVTNLAFFERSSQFFNIVKKMKSDYSVHKRDISISLAFIFIFGWLLFVLLF